MDSYISLAGILETPMEQSWRGTGWRGWVFKKTLIYTVPVAVVLHKSHTLPVNNPKYVVCRMMYCRWLFCCIWLGCQFFFFFLIKCWKYSIYWAINVCIASSRRHMWTIRCCTSHPPPHSITLCHCIHHVLLWINGTRWKNVDLLKQIAWSSGWSSWGSVAEITLHKLYYTQTNFSFICSICVLFGVRTPFSTLCRDEEQHRQLNIER